MSTGDSTSSSESTGTPPDPDTFVADINGTSTVQTGDVVAGNVDNTKICQVHNADPTQCTPQVVRWIVLPGRPTPIPLTQTPKTPTAVTVSVKTVTQVVTPSLVRGIEVVAPKAGGVKGETLPVTGAETDGNLSFAGLLLGAGIFLVLVAALVPRRRATG